MPFPNNSGIGRTISLSSNLSISILLRLSILALPSVISSIDGTSNIEKPKS